MRICAWVCACVRVCVCVCVCVCVGLDATTSIRFLVASVDHAWSRASDSLPLTLGRRVCVCVCPVRFVLAPFCCLFAVPVLLRALVGARGVRVVLAVGSAASGLGRGLAVGVRRVCAFVVAIVAIAVVMVVVGAAGADDVVVVVFCICRWYL